MKIPKLGPVIAIDGPAGTGKSATTKALAEALGFVHVDTGSLYRSLAFLLIETGQPEPTEEQSSELSRNVHFEFRYDESLTPKNRIHANGRDVSAFIRSPQVSMLASKISAFSGVRASLLGIQRRLGCVGKTILEGRDIGTVIFPDADVKFFLTASVEVRAERRLQQLRELGQPVPPLNELKAQIEKRDRDDSTRAIAPLKKSEDAIEIDTTSLSLDQVVEKMKVEIRSKLHLQG